MADLEKMGAREWLNRKHFTSDAGVTLDCFAMLPDEHELALTIGQLATIMDAYANHVRRLGSAGQGEPNKALQNITPQCREANPFISRSEGPWTVMPDATTCPPYTYAVVGSKGMKVAFAVTEKTAQSYADQMNEKGYIENPD